MTTFSQLLHNRLTNIPAVKDLLTGPSTQSLRQRFNMRLEVGRNGTFAYILLCSGLIASVFYMPMVLQQKPSALFWSVWGASAMVCALWGMYFGRWIYDAAHEWHKKAQSLGLGYFGIRCDIKQSTAAQKVSVIALCTKLGATPAQIQQLYAASKDDDLPETWWGDLEREASDCAKKKQYEDEISEQRERQIAARLKINLYS